MTSRLRFASVLVFGLCAGLSATVAANGYPTGAMQPGLYKVEGRLLNAQAGSGAGAADAVRNFRSAMSGELAARQICFTPEMTRRGASALLTEGRQGCSFEPSREDSSGFQGYLRCPGDAESGQPSPVSGVLYERGADYTVSASGPMMIGESMSRIDFRARYVATRIGECR